MSLGLPGGIEARKKAYLGVGMDDLLARYSEAERKRDLPEMLALLDIIRAAPKPVVGPKTTVKDDLMAAVQPRPQPQPMMASPAAGVEGALTAMENQNPPVLAAEGGAMNFDDSPDTYGFAEGGVARFQFGGAGTVAPYSSFSALSFADVERMAMMGDPDAQKELSNRMRANVKPPPTPGPGIGPTSPQVTDRFGSPGKIPAGVPGSTTPVTPPAAAGATTRPGLASLASRVAKIPGMGLITRHPYLTAGTAALTLGQPIVDRLMATDQGTPSAELDPIAAMQGTQGGVDRSATGDSRFMTASPRDKGAPTVPAPGPAPGAPAGTPTTGLPSLPFNLADLRPKSIEDLIAERNLYEAKLDKQGLRSLKDVQSDLEKFRTEGKERAESDRAAAKKAFQEELLLGAALSAPQLLKGRGLSQAVARATETFSPLAMKAAASKTSSIKEADKMERESADKYKLAQLDLDKAIRAEELGKFDKAASLRSDSMKTYTQAALDKYKSDVYYAATMGYVDREIAKGMVNAARDQIGALQLNPEFRKQPIDVQQRMIQSILSNAAGQGGQQRPKIVDVPGQ